MKLNIQRQSFWFLLMLLMTAALLACEKPKEVKLAVSNQEFSVQRVSEWGFEMTAKGRVRNVGEADVRNVVVTGYCLSCPETMQWESWFISDIDKTDEEEALITYLVPGAEQTFEFGGVAMYMSRSGQAPEGMPEQMEIKVASFEAVQ